MASARNRVNDRDREHGRKGNCKDLFSLERAASFGRKGHVRHTCSVCHVWYVGFLRNNRYVDCWILKLVLPDRSSKYRQTDPRKSAKKPVRFLEKLTCSKVRWDL